MPTSSEFFLPQTVLGPMQSGGLIVSIALLASSACGMMVPPVEVAGGVGHRTTARDSLAQQAGEFDPAAATTDPERFVQDYAFTLNSEQVWVKDVPRRFEVGLGWGLRGHSRIDHGPLVQFSGRLVRKQLKERKFVDVQIRSRSQYLFVGGEEDYGLRTGAMIVGQLLYVTKGAKFKRGEGNSFIVAGRSRGHMSFGVYVAADHTWMPRTDRHDWTVTGGLIMRLPFLGFLGMAPRAF